jgi:hypothetical protein
MYPKGTKRRTVILRDDEYKMMCEAAKRNGRTFSNWAAECLRHFLWMTPVGRANARRWDQ